MEASKGKSCIFDTEYSNRGKAIVSNLEGKEYPKSQFMAEKESDRGDELLSISEVLKEVAEDYKNSAEQIAEHKSIVTGLPTGFYDFDYMTKGLQKGELIVLAGRKWMGKKGLALSIVDHVVMKEKVPTVIFSPDLSARQVAKRLLAIEADDKATIVMQGPSKPEDLDTIENGMETLGSAQLFIVDSNCISVEDIRRKCINLKKEEKLGLVVIDYLQLLTCETVGYEENSGKKIMLGLKSLAREIDCPILVISELSSYGEKLWNLRPELMDIGEADYSRQYADLIMMLYVDKLNSLEEPEQNNAELIIVKNRNGSVGKIKLKSEFDGLRYRNLLR